MKRNTKAVKITKKKKEFLEKSYVKRRTYCIGHPHCPECSTKPKQSYKGKITHQKKKLIEDYSVTSKRVRW